MKQILFTLVLVVFAVMGSATTAKAKSADDYLRERIKESMEETEEQHDKMMKFLGDIGAAFDEKGLKGDISFSQRHGLSQNNPSIVIRVKNKQYKQKYEGDMKQLVQNLAKSYNLDNVGVKVKVHEPEMDEISEEDRKQRDQTMELFEIAHDVMEQHGYKYGSMSIDSINRSNPKMVIQIDVPKKKYEQIKDEIAKLVHDKINAIKQLDYDVRVTRKTAAEKRNEAWQPIFHAIMDEMRKNFKEVTGFASSLHPEPLQIIIKTSLSKDDPEGQKLAQKMEKYVDLIIDIQRGELSVKKEPYKVIIRGKEKEQLN